MASGSVGSDSGSGSGSGSGSLDAATIKLRSSRTESFKDSFLFSSDIASGLAGAAIKAAMNEGQRSGNTIAMNTVKYGLNSVLSRWVTYSESPWSSAVNSLTGKGSYGEYMNAVLLGALYNAVRGKTVMSSSLLVYPAANYLGDMIAMKNVMEKKYI